MNIPVFFFFQKMDVHRTAGHSFLLAKTLHGTLNNDTSLAVLTFDDWPFYLLRNNSDVVIQRKFYTTLLYVSIFVPG